MESKGTTVVASCIHQALTDSHRYTTLTDATGRNRLLQRRAVGIGSVVETFLRKPQRQLPVKCF